MPTYHDVIVYVGNTEYKPSTNYELELSCTKVAGWQLWKSCRDPLRRWENEKSELIGGEYDGEPFCIVVGGFVACGKRPTGDIAQPRPFGWDGTVTR